jgi:hypothetical protein
VVYTGRTRERNLREEIDTYIQDFGGKTRRKNIPLSHLDIDVIKGVQGIQKFALRLIIKVQKHAKIFKQFQ